MRAARIALLVKNPEDAWEGLRSALGLCLEGLTTDLFFLGCLAGPSPDQSEEDFQETLEMLMDLGGQAFSNLPANRERWDGVACFPLKTLAEKIKGCQMVAPF
jgi:hypothetical protein